MKRSFGYLLVVYLLMTFAPFALHFPVWLTVALGSGLLAGFHGFRRSQEKPSKFLISAAIILALITLYLQFGTLLTFSLIPHFMALMVMIKFLETRTYKDVMTLTLISYLLILCYALSSSSLAPTVYSAILFVTSIFVLVDLHSPQDALTFLSIRKALRLLALASPFVIFLFLLFPRIQVDAVSNGTKSKSQVGFSNRLEPGEMADLVESNRIAFRVKPPSHVPIPMDLRYWRGTVLTNSSGLSWDSTTNHAELLSSEFKEPQVGGRVYLYEITLEPQSGPWLFGMDRPYSMRILNLENQVFVSQESEFQMDEERRDLVYYQIYSVVHSTTEAQEPDHVESYLQIPKDLDPEILKLAQSWVHQSTSDQELVDLALRYFETNGFSYSLSSHLTKKDKLKEFLFETKSGFCEHYAATFATLMRAAGIPSRVIIGYHGGLNNRYGDYILVRDRDAHAWVEVWQTHRGWVRVDPTTVVAPMRIAMGGQDYLRDQLESVGEPGFLDQLVKNTFLANLRLSSEVPLAWDAITNNWNLFLFNYNFEAQSLLLEFFGIAFQPWLILAVVLIGAILFGFILIYLHFRSQPQYDQVTVLYQKLCDALEKRGLSISNSEGPITLFERAALAFPSHRQELEVLFTDYTLLRFGKRFHQADLKEFQTKIRNLSKWLPNP